MFFLRAFRYLPVILLPLISACAIQQRNYDADATTITLPDTDYRKVENLQYTPPEWPTPLEAEIYLPTTAGPKPAVLVVHGGGWHSGKPALMRPICKQLASHGFVAININYRLAPDWQFPAQLQDLQMAMHWIHSVADQYQIDTDHIAALGYSAGAHLVSLLGMVAGTGDELDRQYGGPLTRPAAIIAGGTPSNLRELSSINAVPQFLGGTIDEIPQKYAIASPIVHVHQGAPPVFIYHGTMDSLVPTDQATDFADKLREKDVVTEVYLMRIRGHILATLIDNSAIDAAMAFMLRQYETN